MSKEKIIEIPIKEDSLFLPEKSFYHDKLLEFAPPSIINNFTFMFIMAGHEVCDDKLIHVSKLAGNFNFELKPNERFSNLDVISLDGIMIVKEIEEIYISLCYVYAPHDLPKQTLEYLREHYMEITDDVRH